MQQSSKPEKIEPSFVENQIQLVCANCKREADSDFDRRAFKLCSGCYKVHYCNRDCQLADRKNHKASCKAAKTSTLNSTQTILAGDFHNLF